MLALLAAPLAALLLAAPTQAHWDIGGVPTMDWPTPHLRRSSGATSPGTSTTTTPSRELPEPPLSPESGDRAGQERRREVERADPRRRRAEPPQPAGSSLGAIACGVIASSASAPLVSGSASASTAIRPG